ncbi:MAG: ADOP family duplicated permease [Vicinamibacterales bacterium]
MPDWTLELRERLAGLSLDPAREAEIIEELSQHLDERFAELCASGVADAEARRVALGELLDLNALAAEMSPLRQSRVQPPETPRAPGRFVVGDWWYDIRVATRRLRRQPTFTCAAVAILALGIGATTAIFSIVKSVLIDPLPYPDGDALVSLVHTVDGRDEASFSDAIYLHYLEHSRTFEKVGVWNPYAGAATVTGRGTPEEVRALVANRGLLITLGAQPGIGRVFSERDDTPGAPDTVILTHGYWQRRFGANRAIIGQAIIVNGRPHQVIGIMRPEFRFGGNVVNTTLTTWAPDIVLPLRINATRPVPLFRLLGVGRLKPGVTLAEAHADVDHVLAIWKASWASTPSPFSNTRYGSSLRPFKQDVIGGVGTTLSVVMGAAAIVFLMACANIANLLLLRADARIQEFAIRTALGARWTRLAREVVVECLILACAGGLLGVGLASGGLRLLAAYGPPDLPRLAEISMDGVTLGFALAMTLTAAALFGSIPIARHLRPRLALALGSTGRGATLARDRQRTQQALVAAQLALAVVLLIGSSLMIRSALSLRRVDPGFAEPHRVQTFAIAIPPIEVAEVERVLRLQQQIVNAIGAIPGVESVAFTTRVPMDTTGRTSAPWVPEHRAADGRTPPSRQMRSVSPGLFRTLGSGVIAGRDFTWTDLEEGRDVAIVSANLADEWWGSAALAIGKRVRNESAGPWREVVGVVADIHDEGADQPAIATVFLPARAATRRVSFVARSGRAGTEGFLAELRQAVATLNGNLPLAEVRTLGDLYDQSMARTSFTLAMLTVSGVLALCLGILGVYGVIAYAVAQRRREIGIRMTLGAQPGTIQALFLRRGLALAVIGVAVGMCAAIASTQVMQALLFRISALDPVSFAVAPVVLIAATLVATFVTARRALVIDPIDTLRSE